MPFFIRAKSNESIVLKTFGIPISAARSWSLIPFPCCQVAKRFNLGRYSIRFESSEIKTRDEMIISLVFSVKFIVDRSSRSKIMKAYKDLVGYEEEAGKEVIDIDSKIVEIIHEVVKKDLAKMSLSELIKFNWLFADSIFTEVKFILKDSSVMLIELILDEIQQFPLEEETILQEVKMKFVESQEFLDELDGELLETEEKESVEEPKDISRDDTRELELTLANREQITMIIDKKSHSNDNMINDTERTDSFTESMTILPRTVSVLFIENPVASLLIRNVYSSNETLKENQPTVKDENGKYNTVPSPKFDEIILNKGHVDRNLVVLKQNLSNIYGRGNTWKILKEPNLKLSDSNNDNDDTMNNAEVAALESNDKTHLLTEERKKSLTYDAKYLKSEKENVDTFEEEVHLTDEKNVLLYYPDMLSFHS